MSKVVQEYKNFTYTTVGEIEIELWSKETPKACRNFLALSMEGYYDGVIFHRVVPNFLVQTGDRTGTGGGGESFYGDQFEDEIHPRLRFVHRGLVGMANNSEKNTNDSQFFITLDRADELNGKHTLFGRVVGNTLFNVLKIGEAELGKNERPVYPPKIKSVRIIDNPFDDIVPRITAEEKRAQKRAREEAQREREEAARRKGAKKNVGLLSFGDAPDEDSPVTFKKKSIARPDLVDPGPEAVSAPDIPQPLHLKKRVASSIASPLTTVSNSESSGQGGEPASSNILGIREQHERNKASESATRQAEIAKMEADIKRLARKKGGDDSDDEEEQAQKKARSGQSALEQDLARYRNKGSKGKLSTEGKLKKRDENDLMARLEKFKGKLKQGEISSVDGSSKPEDAGDGGASPSLEAEMDVDIDNDWIGHRLNFPKGNEEEVSRAEHDYEVIDPRARGAQARQQELERKRARKPHVGSAFRR